MKPPILAALAAIALLIAALAPAFVGSRHGGTLLAITVIAMSVLGALLTTSSVSSVRR